MSQPQQKPQQSQLEKLGKRVITIIYLALCVFVVNLYFTFTPVEHKFIKRYWIEDKKKNGVIVKNEQWEFNLNGIEVPQKFSLKKENNFEKTR